MHSYARFSSLALLFVVSACNKDDAPKPAPAAPSAPVAPAGSRYLLAKEPAGAIAVLAAKAKGEAKGVTVVGRLKDTVHGFAAFTLTDVSLAYCGEGGTEENCPTPWDYCCIPDDKVAEATISVAAREKGEVVEATVPELRNLDLVVVHGDLVKTKDGSLRLDADGWFRKERPPTPKGVEFPK